MPKKISRKNRKKRRSKKSLQRQPGGGSDVRAKREKNNLPGYPRKRVEGSSAYLKLYPPGHALASGAPHTNPGGATKVAWWTGEPACRMVGNVRLCREPAPSLKNISDNSVQIIQNDIANEKLYISLLNEEKSKIIDFRVVWKFMGLDHNNYLANQLIIHEYQSSSTPPFAKIKNQH